MAPLDTSIQGFRRNENRSIRRGGCLLSTRHLCLMAERLVIRFRRDDMAFPGWTLPAVRTADTGLRLARARRFGHGLGRPCAPHPELDRLARPDTILCRCEEITRAEVQAACAEGVDSIHGAKIRMRQDASAGETIPR